MKNYKELVKNIGVLTLSNFGSKILGFLLIPLYTSALSTSEYGSYDFIYTTISLLIPLLTLNISESALRFLLEKKYSNNQIIRITFKYNIFSIFIVIALAIINYMFGFINLINNYFFYFLLMYICNLFYIMFQNIVRGYDQIKDIAVSGIVNSVLTLSLNLLFLLYFKYGLSGYFIATIISNFVSSFYLFFRIKNAKNNEFGKKNNSIEKKMVEYSCPLMLNSISWWINNVSDRYIVTFICGIAANGIYSVAYKIPSILSVFQTIFNQAWGISSVKQFDKNDSNDFFSNTYAMYNYMMVLCCSILIIFTRVLARFLYLNEFSSAWIYTPFLIISILFGGLSGYFGGIFSALKNSKIIGNTTFLGASINIVLNFTLIPFIGVIGAAIATLVSYFIIWVIRLHYVRKSMNIKLHLTNDFTVYTIILIQTILIMSTNNALTYIIEVVLFFIINIIYYDNFLKIVRAIGGKRWSH